MSDEIAVRAATPADAVAVGEMTERDRDWTVGPFELLGYRLALE